MSAPAVSLQKPPSVIPYIAALLAFSIGFALGGASRGGQRAEVVRQPIAPPAVGSYAPDAWKLWVDSWQHRGGDAVRGYEVSYPRDFEVYRGIDATGGWIGDTRVVIVAPSDAFSEIPNNFSEAFFSVAIADDVDEKECYLGPVTGDGAGAELTATREVNGVTFRTGTVAEGAAGSRYDTELYRTYRGETCIEVALIVQTSNIDNYSSGVHEFDKERAFGILRTMLGTFRLTDGTSGVEGP